MIDPAPPINTPNQQPSTHSDEKANAGNISFVMSLRRKFGAYQPVSKRILVFKFPIDATPWLLYKLTFQVVH